MAKVGIEWMISVCSHPGMHIPNPTFKCVCAYIAGYIAGYDAGQGSSVLWGFKMWLMLKDGNRDLYSLQWSSLVLRRLFPEKNLLGEVLSAEEDNRCIVELGRCLELYSNDLEFGDGVLNFRFIKWFMKSRHHGK